MSSTSRGLSSGAAGQLIAGAGSLLVLLSPILLALAGVGLALLLLGVIVSAPSARLPGPYLQEWWTALAICSLVCLAGFVLELLVPVAGGVLLTVGGVAGLAAVALGTPPQGESGGAAESGEVSQSRA